MFHEHLYVYDTIAIHTVVYN